MGAEPWQGTGSFLQFTPEAQPGFQLLPTLTPQPHASALPIPCHRCSLILALG